ncbi:MAG: hypothetical protein ACK53Y_04205, partial [bacterium]
LHAKNAELDTTRYVECAGCQPLHADTHYAVRTSPALVGPCTPTWLSMLRWSAPARPHGLARSCISSMGEQSSGNA